MSEPRSGDSFLPLILDFTAAVRARLAHGLDELALEADERRALRSAGERALNDNARLKLNRLLLLELQAARLGGQLQGSDDAAQFGSFLERAATEAFHAHLRQRYPALHPRLHRALDGQCRALLALGARLAADRDALSGLLGRPAGRLLELSTGEGDLHAGGQSVAQLRLEGGRVMYKPRSLRIDATLDAFLARVFAGEEPRIRVPPVLDRGDYGWAAFVEQRYCADDAELSAFYRRLGHWLAVLQALGGTDIHQENLIAAGPVPVAIDVETLFAIERPSPPSGRGEAFDLASEGVRTSVLRTGIVPFRAPLLGLGGVDVSAAGALPGEQPRVRVPGIVEEGTPRARLEVIETEFGGARNHPSPQPDPARFWDQVDAGFQELTARLRRLDAEGALAPWLEDFLGCRVRDIRRPTQVYVELLRMLWHPASLHGEAKAVERARDLLARNAAVLPIAPSAPAQIQAEIDDLRYGDVPLFAAPLAPAQLQSTLQRWRAMRIELEALTIRSALVVVELNQRMGRGERARGGVIAHNPHARELDLRRRRLAAQAVAQLLRLAVRGGDGSVTWISPVLGRGGWITRPLQADLYTGLGGVALALAGYRSECAQGRADPVEGLDATLDGALRSLEAMEAAEAPGAVGGWIGYGAQVWTWLALHELLGQRWMLDHAGARAQALAEAGFASDEYFDLLEGAAGAIVPLLQLAQARGEACWLDLAAQAALHLETHALDERGGACWPTGLFPRPVGGFAHGASGIGWALRRISLSGAGGERDRARWRALADRAFAFEDALFDPALGCWRDARDLEETQLLHAWCHGSVGIGLAAADLYARTGEARHGLALRRAAAVAGRGGWGLGHTLCHGDLGLWELLQRAARLDPDGGAETPRWAAARIVSAIEEYSGAVGSLARDTFTPGLMTGVSGAIHLLNRFHPDSVLGSPLLLELPGEARAAQRAAAPGAGACAPTAAPPAGRAAASAPG